MSDKPTGVFVRFPLSDEQARNIYIECSFEEEGNLEGALCSIGTPVTGGKLQSVREFVDNYAFIADCGNSVLLTDAHKTLLEDAICSYAHDAQAQIAALEAEVVCLRGVIVESVDALTRVTEERSTRYQAKNGRWVSIQADDGERCDIIHSDITTDCEAAILSAHKALKGGAA